MAMNDEQLEAEIMKLDLDEEYEDEVASCI